MRAVVNERRSAPIGNEYRPAYCARIIAFMTEGYSFSAFAGEVGVSIWTLQEWRNRFPDFREAAERGKAARLKTWESKAMDFAFGRTEKGNAAVLLRGLAKASPEEWQEAPIELKGSVGVFDAAKFAQLTDDELERLESLLTKIGAGAELDRVPALTIEGETSEGA